MIKISVNLDNNDAKMIDQLAAGKNEGSKSNIIRTAIHEYCEKAMQKKSGVHYAIDSAFGIFKETPLDADAIRRDSNESGKV